MSNESIQATNSFGANVAGVLAFPAITQGASAINAVKTHGKDVFKVQNRKNFKALGKAMQTDVFTRSEALAKSYDTYKGLTKANAKALKKQAKFAKKGDISLKDKFLNLFRANDSKTTKESIEAGVKEAEKALKKANDAILEANKSFNSQTAKNLDLILDENVIEATKKAKATDVTGLFESTLKSSGKIAGEVAESATKSSIKGFGKYFKNNFVKELGLKNGKFNYFMTLVTITIPQVVNNVIPTFKEKGFVGGIKELGKTIARSATDLVGYATGGALGRAVGAAIGTIICPGAGSAVGATVGDMIGSVVIGGASTKIVDKLTGAKDEAQATGEASNDASAQTDANKQTAKVDTTPKADIKVLVKKTFWLEDKLLATMLS